MGHTMILSAYGVQCCYADLDRARIAQLAAEAHGAEHSGPFVDACNAAPDESWTTSEGCSCTQDGRGTFPCQRPVFTSSSGAAETRGQRV